MRSERYDTLISIEYKGEEQEPVFGTRATDWLRLCQGYAEVQDMLPSRSESVLQGARLARDQVRIRMRYRSDVTREMRIIAHRGTDEVYQIVGGPAMLGRQEALEMVCERFSV
jgi:head-tail adaptor